MQARGAGEQIEGRRPDRRVVRTKTAIREALKTLLSRKKMDEITVTELAESAGVNRKTFYNYYSGVYAVMDEIEDEIAGNLRKAFENVNFQTLIRNPDEAFHRLDVWIMSDEKFYEKVMTLESQYSLRQKILNTLKDTMWKALSPHFRSDQQLALEVAIEYGISGILEVYRKWFLTGKKTDLATITDYISMVTLNGILGLAKEYR
jgi:AcrR family transcriptional regulator